MAMRLWSSMDLCCEQGVLPGTVGSLRLVPLVKETRPRAMERICKRGFTIARLDIGRGKSRRRA
jgi:hypothetical protein